MTRRCEADLEIEPLPNVVFLHMKPALQLNVAIAALTDERTFNGERDIKAPGDREGEAGTRLAIARQRAQCPWA